jgi:hypothetical protein
MDLIIQRRLPHLGGGWFASECPADLERNRWPVWIGMGGRFASEYAWRIYLINLDIFNTWIFLTFNTPALRYSLRARGSMSWRQHSTLNT